MKSIVPAITRQPTPVVLAVFCVFAFLPSVLHLVSRDIAVTNPMVALGPVAAGFWFAATVRDIRMNTALLGVLITVFLWSVNWLMLAGSDCCSTMH